MYRTEKEADEGPRTDGYECPVPVVPVKEPEAEATLFSESDRKVVPGSPGIAPHEARGDTSRGKDDPETPNEGDYGPGSD